MRLTHSTASSSERTCQSQKPAISSFVSAKGPSMTVFCVPSNLTRLPFELGCSPSPASITPAFTSSSLNFPISVNIFSPGSTPASETAFALIITITLISSLSLKVILTSLFEPALKPALYIHDERAGAESTRGENFFRFFLRGQLTAETQRHG